MSIATVVTRGYGSFAGINWLPTFGYTIGEPETPSHWHDLLGSSEQLYVLTGASTQPHTVVGPNEQLYVLRGCDQ